MGDVVKRTAFYNTRKSGNDMVYEYLPFYLVEIEGATESQLFQPVNFNDRVVGTMEKAVIKVDEYKHYHPSMRLLMDRDRQLMNFQSCEWPIR